MPHAKKPKVSKKQRALARARRSKQRKREKDEFAHIEYLKSQLDEKGQPIDILHTDEHLLNNEQKYIVRIINELSHFNPLSITDLIDDYYDDDVIDEIVDYYYTNKQNKSWSDRLFKATYNCLRITNLTHLLKENVLYHMDELFSQFSDTDVETDKPVLTEEIMFEIIEKCKSDIPDEINISEVINSLLLVYIQNVQTCYMNETAGGNIRNKVQQGGNIVVLILIFVVMIFIWFFLKGKKSIPSTAATHNKPTAEDLAILKQKIERDRRKAVEKYKKEQAEKKKQEEIETELTDAEIAQMEAEYGVGSEEPLSQQSKQPSHTNSTKLVANKSQLELVKKQAEETKQLIAQFSKFNRKVEGQIQMANEIAKTREAQMQRASSGAEAVQPKNEVVITSADIRSWKKSQETEKLSSNPNPRMLELRPEHFAILRMKNERDRLKAAEKEKEQNDKKDN